jgi:hypothetical protein
MNYGGHEKKEDVMEVLISLNRNTVEMANSELRNRKPSETTPELNAQRCAGKHPSAQQRNHELERRVPRCRAPVHPSRCV